MSKVSVVTGVRIEVEAPYHLQYYRRGPGGIERYTKELEYWAREFEAFVRDHRSQDPVSLDIVREREDQCSHCHSEWEVDEHGCPVCCDAAIEEWETEHEQV